ncbi:ATP-binding protein [Shewanella algae]|uniref:ATP-binding protein n=1 Tax=Shewanella algae TaxID=38313 RepID=UPI001AAC46A0|nr:ATP-binding protein [Shewanella algae]
MNKSQSLQQMLQRLNAPAHIEPCSRDVIERMRIEDEQRISNEHKARRAAALVGQSGLNQRFLDCTLDNYRCSCKGQYQAVDAAKGFLTRFAEFSSTGRGFLFYGNPGTGKNHVASAIANALMKRSHTVVMMSVMDLMDRARSCYRWQTSEEQLLRDFCRPELLIIDEIGLQRSSDDERLWLTRIIDRRLYGNRATSFITNLDGQGLRDVLGVRGYERLKEAVGMAVKFDWESYRGRGGNHEAA